MKKYIIITLILWGLFYIPTTTNARGWEYVTDTEFYQTLQNIERTLESINRHVREINMKMGVK